LFLFVVLQKCKSLNVLYLLSFTFKFHLEFIANKWCVTLWQISIKFSTPFNNPLIFLWLSRECIETCAQKTTCVCFFIFYCCAGGTFVTFIKVLKMYQIYHSWIHLLHHSPLSPHSWNSFNKSHFSICIHVYTIFVPYSSSYTLSPHPPPPTGTNPQTGPVLPSYSLFKVEWMKLCK
jgi:hypothetical protein